LVIVLLQLRSRGVGRPTEIELYAEQPNQIIENPSSLELAFKSYLTKHQQLLGADIEDRKHLRYVLFVAEPKHGFAERFLSLTSAFVFALLSNRYFLVDWKDMKPPGTKVTISAPLEDMIDLPFEWRKRKVVPDGHESGTPKITLRGKCSLLRGGVLSKPYEVFKCTNFTEFFYEFPVVRIQGNEFFADWFQYNEFYKNAMKHMFYTNENIFGSLAKLLLSPNEASRMSLQSFKQNQMAKFDIVIGLHTWYPDDNNDYTSLDDAIFSCAVNRKKEMEQQKKIRVGILLVTEKAETKVRASDIFGSNLLIYTYNSSLSAEGVIDNFVEMLLLGECDEIITSPEISNFTKVAVSTRPSVPVYSSEKCTSQSANTLKIKTHEVCLHESICGFSVRNPWRAEPPLWFFLRVSVFVLIILGLFGFVTRWCIEKTKTHV